MPKSRKRRKATRSRRRTYQGRTSHSRPRAVDDPESARLQALLSAVVAVDRAEIAGDARGALRIIEETPLTAAELPFWKPQRVRRLAQVAELGALLPGWARSRWILEQALSVLDETSRARDFVALETAIEARGGAAALPGVDDVDARARVMDHDWLYRQLCLYELGGLQHFVDTIASTELVDAADGIREWAGAEMGGHRLLRLAPRTLTWEDLGTGAVVEMLNIGAAALVDVGECVIGRVVPILDGLMFETAPLRVPDEVAIRVASAPEDWPDALITGCLEHGEDPDLGIVLSGPFDYGLLTDVPRAVWRHMAVESLEDATLGRATDESLLLAGHLVLRGLGAAVDVEIRNLREAVDGEAHEHLLRLWPAVAAALTEPGLGDYVEAFVSPQLTLTWRLLAACLPEPADELAHELADLCADAA